VGEVGRVLAAGRRDGDDLARGEEPGRDDGGVDFLFQGCIEAGLAELWWREGERERVREK
jgi:hypothetical protein